MLSKVSIDVDEDNAPIIKIQHISSEDVRDKLVKRFLQSFGGECEAEITFIHNPNDKEFNNLAMIRPPQKIN